MTPGPIWTKPESLHVRVEAPFVEGPRVTFRWKAQPTLGTFGSESFYVDYGVVDTASFGTAVHWNTFFSLMLPVLSEGAYRVQVDLDEAVPVDVVSTWLRFHQVDNVTVHPLSDPGARRALPPRLAGRGTGERACVLFGGGKDCSFGEGVMRELHPDVELGLLSVDHPFSLHSESVAQYRRRRENFVVGPARRRAQVRTPRVSTDFVARVGSSPSVRAGRDRSQVLMALYLGPLLPVLHWCGFTEVIFNYDASHFWTRRSPSQEWYYSFRRARPEPSRFLEDRYRSTFGLDLRMTNLSYPIDVMLTSKIVAERFPDLFGSILMCESTTDPGTRWCMRCGKCAQFHLYAMLYPAVTGGAEPDWFFADSHYIERALGVLDDVERSGLVTSSTGNGPFRVELTRPLFVGAFCEALHRIGRDGAADRLGGRARDNLKRLVEVYGNEAQPGTEVVFSIAAEHAGLRDPAAFLELCAEHGPVSAEPSFVGRYGNDEVIYDWEPVPGRPSPV